jgi:DNA-binding CsgD family transcriptional regulator
VLEDLVERTEPGPLRATAMHRLAYFVEYERGTGLGERALVEAGDDGALRADIHITIADMAHQRGRYAEALAHSEAALEQAERVGEASGIAHALLNVAFSRWAAGEGVQRELLARADALERQGGGRVRDVTPAIVLGMQLQSAGELAEARPVLEAERVRAASRGHLDHESQVLAQLAQLELAAGDWRKADDYARRALEMTLGWDFWNAETMGRQVCALVDAHLGRVDSARELAETGRRASEEWGDLIWVSRCDQVLGFLELSLGDAPAVVVRLSSLLEQELGSGVEHPALLWVGPDLIEALVLTGDLEEARAVEARLMATACAPRQPWAIAAAYRCRGLIESAGGRPEGALVQLERALAIHADLERPFDRARTLLALGAVQRRAKQRAEARATLESALAVFEGLGAKLWAERARGEIARLGGRRAHDRDELTETERRIAELAAEGRSNREIAGELFVSERTVESNLTRAYRKLGVRSRTELARRLPAD